MQWHVTVYDTIVYDVKYDKLIEESISSFHIALPQQNDTQDFHCRWSLSWADLRLTACEVFSSPILSRVDYLGVS